MKKVTKDYFYSVMNPLDIVVNVHGDWPYTTDFKTRNGNIKGRVCQKYSDGNKYPIVKEYFTDL